MPKLGTEFAPLVFMLCKIQSLVCISLFLSFSTSAYSEVNKKNPFEVVFKEHQVASASQFVELALIEQKELLKMVPEYSQKLKGIQSRDLTNEFRRAQFFYNDAVIKFIKNNYEFFIKLDPTPEQVNAILKRATVDVPLSLFEKHAKLFVGAYKLQKKILNHFLKKSGTWSAVQTLINYRPQDVYIQKSQTVIIETHIDHLTRLAMVDSLFEWENIMAEKPHFYSTLSYLKHYFHYPYSSVEQKAKKLISIVLDVASDMPNDFLNYKRGLRDQGFYFKIDYLDETNALQFKNAKNQAKFLESQLLKVLKNYLDIHFVAISLNLNEQERILKLAGKYNYTLDVENGKLVGLSKSPEMYKKIYKFFMPPSKRSPLKQCFRLFI